MNEEEVKKEIKKIIRADYYHTTFCAFKRRGVDCDCWTETVLNVAVGQLYELFTKYKTL